MIEVKARMVRSAVHLAGETIQCEIIFSNINENAKECPSPSSVNHFKLGDTVRKVERLAWASVQIHCQCSVNSNRVIIPGKEDTVAPDILSPIAKSRTSFAPSRG